MMTGAHSTHKAGWTDDRVQVLTSMWRSGSSALQIALALGGGLSRNGVIGKINRLKLERRSAEAIKAAGIESAKRAREAKGARVRRKTVEAPAPAQSPTIAPSPVDPDSRKILASTAWAALAETSPKSLVDLLPRECKWPIGDAPIQFCAAPAEGMYCAAHQALAVKR